MKTTLTVTSRGVVTLPAKLLLRPAVALPVEMYDEARIREFDEAEVDLEKTLRRKKNPAR